MQTLRTLGALAVALLLLLAAPAARAASLQPIGSFAEPIYVTSDPANPDRLFVVERQGRIMQVEDGAVGVFADVSFAVGCGGACEGERGLLSAAPAPDFASSGRFFIDYAQDVDGQLHVAELVASGRTAPFSSLRDVLVIPHPGQSNHNGGQLQFGPDGYLYVSTGDGGGKDDPNENAQKLGSQLGKILRIDPNPSGLLPYTVPPGNPFAALGSPQDTVWSYGLRNPFRFSFDRGGSGIVIGDVGQEKREEIDWGLAPGFGAGANYGWSCREGSEPGPNAGSPLCMAPPSPFVDPVFDYPRSDPGGGGAFGQAIIGGYVVRDSSLGDLYGRYLYGDLNTGELRSLVLADPRATDDRAEGIHVDDLNSFGEDSCGRIYVVSGNGPVSRLDGAAANPCGAPPAVERGSSFVGIKAMRRKVRRNSRALITVWVSPCGGRRGDRVWLFRGRKRLGTKYLSRACTVHYRPRIGRRWNFRAFTPETDRFLAGQSRLLKVRIDHRRKARKRAQ